MAAWIRGVWLGGLPALKPAGVQLLDFCSSHTLSTGNTMFEQKDVHKCIWYQGTLGPRSVSTAHHSVMSWTRCQRRMQDWSGRPKQTVKVRWEYLPEDPARIVFSSHFWQNLNLWWNGIWRAVAEVVVRSCGRKVPGASHVGNHWTCLWTPKLEGTVKS